MALKNGFDNKFEELCANIVLKYIYWKHNTKIYKVLKKNGINIKIGLFKYKGISDILSDIKSNWRNIDSKNQEEILSIMNWKNGTEDLRNYIEN